MKTCVQNALRAVFLAALIGSFSGYGRLALAQDQEAATPDWTTESYGDWSVRCATREGVPPCDIVQVATDNKTGAQVMRLSIAHAGDRERYGVQVIVPLGVLISGGVLVRIDDAHDIKDLKFTRCDAGGGYIEALLDAQMLPPFRRGNKGVLAIIDGNGKPLVVPLSFKGFTAASDVMIDRNRQWAQDKGNKTENQKPPRRLP